MRKILLALLLLSGLSAAAQAADLSSDGPPPVRFARMQNLLAPPADATYSLGGYAPADPNMNPAPNGNPGLIDKSEYASPPGCCGGLWDGYMARPCHHQHHYGMASGCWGCGWGCGHGWGGHAVGGGWGHGWGGGWGGGCGCGQGGYGQGGGCGCASPSCTPVCRQRHHCPLFGCHKRSNCGCDVAGCDSCGCGAASDSVQPTPSNDNAPRPEALEPETTPAPAPVPAGTSAQRQPRVLRPVAAMFGSGS